MALLFTTNVQNNTASINIETTVRKSKSLSSSDCTVSSIITDRDGKILGQTNEQTISLNINETKTINKKLSLENPKFWSVEDPYLYRVITSYKSNGKIIDYEKKRFGIRTISVT